MSDHTPLLTRITEALERLAPPPPPPVDWLAHPAYVWLGRTARPVARLEAPALDLMHGIDFQKGAVVENVARLAQGPVARVILPRRVPHGFHATYISQKNLERWR